MLCVELHKSDQTSQNGHWADSPGRKIKLDIYYKHTYKIVQQIKTMLNNYLPKEIIKLTYSQNGVTGNSLEVLLWKRKSTWLIFTVV